MVPSAILSRGEVLTNAGVVENHLYVIDRHYATNCNFPCHQIWTMLLMLVSVHQS